jgi:radical SAM protein with 4Fe4S-binding SPASM domain
MKDMLKKRRRVVSEYFYPNLFSCASDLCEEVLRTIESKTDETIAIEFGKLFLQKTFVKYKQEICRFELNCNKAFFNIRPKFDSDEYMFFVTHFTKKATEVLFGINKSAKIFSYIDYESKLVHIELSEEYSDVLAADILTEIAKGVGVKHLYDKYVRRNIYDGIILKKNHIMNLQWHITNACQNNCKHCYLKEEQRLLGEDRQAIDLPMAKQIIDEVYLYSLEKKAPARIVLSGGDPLLCTFFWDLLEYANTCQLYPMVKGLLGNPNLITENSAKKLKKMHVETVQFSLEGLQEVNDEIRGEGNWDDVWRAIDILETAGIRTNVMFTVSRKNSEQLIPLINYCARVQKTAFSFSRYCITGEDESLDILTPEEYRTLLLRVFEVFRYWKQEKRSPVSWDLSKDSLYAPLYDEMGIDFYERKSGCCLLGNGRSIAMLPNGLLLFCRRMPKAIGYWPDVSLDSACLMHKNLSYKKIKPESCLGCSVELSCRGGCTAVNYRINGLQDHKDPQCWR